ncbi:Holliday junction branch migration protein RuvA [Oscillatoriales cyanobacterium LEGE 11467]|uniref:Holliday junction branch migration complex subunit RuvA n=1 Tax=Zarconia navalis LEGE 11467 TaxID=1828826 RepID=A0A928VZ14_9CYAN|nr:Holliday junction branch migration protein RuvA [Zarconia navalis]MBE9041883.1 Holliday junction branch migration protein RuvA [Zarconia navalis LEGE 11467]
MISYLKGTLVGIVKQSATRTLLTVEIGGVGYDVQIAPRLVQNLPPSGDPVQIFTHYQVRDEQPILYGFASLAERDLFRQLISVSSIGPQLAIALLSTLELSDLVGAIVSGNIRILSATPGVGKKTAERICLELRTKLSEWRQTSGLDSTPTAGLTPDMREDVEMTLLALGYTPSEVVQALNSLSQDRESLELEDAEAWIKGAISILSHE